MIEYCGGNKPCSVNTHYCHYGENSDTMVCCPKLGNFLKIFFFLYKKTTGKKSCEQSLNIGVGNRDLIRWYYNTKTDKCETFKYGGMRGNENNYLTFKECQNTCLGIILN